ncbi:hypothetical protein BH10PAT1_BH10PAT1_4400 [soil metagenome]
MNTEDLILNIAVNLNRISKYMIDGNDKRVKLFLEDNDYYIKEVEKKKLSDKFEKTFSIFKNKMADFGDAEDYLNWANILTHRAKLA